MATAGGVQRGESSTDQQAVPSELPRSGASRPWMANLVFAGRSDASGDMHPAGGFDYEPQPDESSVRGL